MNKNKVLVLDSDLAAAESAASVCRTDGIKISRASDGRAALEMFLTERPDAIVVSALPRAPEDFNICLAIAKDANPVPIIVLVGPDEEEAFHKGRPRPSGVTAFLVKPFRQEELRAVFRHVLGPPEIDAEDEELDGVLAALNPVKPGAAKGPSKPTPSPAPVRAQAPAKNRQGNVDSIVADILADVGIEKKQNRAAALPPKPRPHRPAPPANPPLSIPVPASAPAPPPSAVVSGIPPLAPRTPRPAPAENPRVAISKDVEKLPELETLPPAMDKPFGGLYENAKKKPGIKSLAVAAGLTLAVTALIFSGLRKKTPAPIPPVGSPVVSDVAPASLQNEPTVPVPAAPESTAGEIEKKPFVPPPKPGPKEASGAETKPSAAAGKTNPIPTKAGETSPPADVALIKVDPAASKSTNLDQIPGLGLQTREISDIPPKPADTILPPVTTPAKDVPPAIKPGQWIPLDQADVQPQLTHSVNAIYPPSMMQLKIEGQLRFLVLISENGDVLKAELMPASTDNLEFEAAARAALLKRKYKPALKDGVPVQVSMPINVVFKLNRKLE